jgi:hypothetical protein
MFCISLTLPIHLHEHLPLPSVFTRNLGNRANFKSKPQTFSSPMIVTVPTPYKNYVDCDDGNRQHNNSEQTPIFQAKRECAIIPWHLFFRIHDGVSDANIC